MNLYDRILMLCDDHRIIDIVYRQHLDIRIVVHEIIHALSPQGKCRHCLTGMDGFGGIVDCLAFDQLHHAVCKHLGMDAQMFFAFKGQANGIRDTADPQLEGGTVGDPLSDQLTDLPALGIDLSGRQGD